MDVAYPPPSPGSVIAIGSSSRSTSDGFHPAFDGQFADRPSGLERVLGQSGRFVVADRGGQRRREHQALLDESRASVGGGQPFDAARAEVGGRGAEQLDRLEHRRGRDREHHVQLEEAARLAESDRRVVADHPGHDHRQALDDDRVDFARHDARARLRLRQRQLPDPRPRTHPHQADVRGDLPEPERGRPDRAVGRDDGVERRLGMEMVVGLTDGQAGEVRETGARTRRVVGMGIDPGPDRGPAERDLQQFDLGGADPPDRLVELTGIALELLPETDRRRILEVGPTGLDDRPEGLRLCGECCPQPLEGGQQRLLDRDRGGQLERGRDRVIRALAPIDVVVRVDLAPATQPGSREMRDHLVHVGVRRGARAGLVDVDRELVSVVAIRHGGCGRGDRLGDIRLQESEFPVRLRRRELDQGERSNESRRHALAGDREVEDGPLRRGAVQARRPGPPSRPSSRAPGGWRAASCRTWSDCRGQGRTVGRGIGVAGRRLDSAR